MTVTPSGAAVDLHPPPAAGDRGGQPVRDTGQIQAQLAGQGGGGQGVRHVVRAVQPEGHPGLAFGCDQREARPPEVIQPDVRGPDRGGAVLHAEGDDPGPGPGGHGQDPGVVGVQDGGPVGGQRLGELALGPGHLVQAAELTGVRVADVQHRAVAGRRDTAQVRDVPGPARGQLQDQVPGRGVRAQHGQRMAELVVERPGGRDRRAEALDQLGGQVLGRRLARRAGDARDGQRGQRTRHEPGQRGQRGRDVGDQDPRSRNRGTGRVASTATAPAETAAAAKSCPSARSPATAANRLPAPARRESITTSPATTAAGSPWPCPEVISAIWATVRGITGPPPRGPAAGSWPAAPAPRR